MKHTRETYQHWLTTCLEDGLNLTAWELDFLQSLESQSSNWGDRWYPTQRQADILERIYSEKTP